MKFIFRVIIAIAFLFAALACYSFGIPAGGIAFFVLGIIFEALFWTGLFGRKQRSKYHS